MRHRALRILEPLSTACTAAAVLCVALLPLGGKWILTATLSTTIAAVLMLAALLTLLLTDSNEKGGGR